MFGKLVAGGGGWPYSISAIGMFLWRRQLWFYNSESDGVEILCVSAFGRNADVRKRWKAAKHHESGGVWLEIDDEF